jgi:glycerol-3-phosphate cytidylyltransferase-like family protein
LAVYTWEETDILKKQGARGDTRFRSLNEPTRPDFVVHDDDDDDDDDDDKEGD